MALVSQGSLGCLQNRKRPFQEHQRQEALLCVSGASGAAGLRSGWPEFWRRWVSLRSWPWPCRSPKALFVQEVEGSCCLRGVTQPLLPPWMAWSWQGGPMEPWI